MTEDDKRVSCNKCNHSGSPAFDSKCANCGAELEVEGAEGSEDENPKDPQRHSKDNTEKSKNGDSEKHVKSNNNNEKEEAHVMSCTKCDAALEEGLNFCTECGTSVEQQSVAESVSCELCSYDLTGLDEGACPRCGTAFSNLAESVSESTEDSNLIQSIPEGAEIVEHCANCGTLVAHSEFCVSCGTDFTGSKFEGFSAEAESIIDSLMFENSVNEVYGQIANAITWGDYSREPFPVTEEKVVKSVAPTSIEDSEETL